MQFGARILRPAVRDRAFFFAAVLVLALGIGSCSAVFSVLDRILFRGLPYPGGGQLVSVGIVEPVISLDDWLFSGTY